MKILRLEDSSSKLELEPKEKECILLSVEENYKEWSSIYISKELAIELVDYLKEYYNI